MKLGAMHRSSGIYVAIEENLRKPWLGDCLKAMKTAIVLSGVPYLQMRSIGSHSTSWKDKVRKNK